MNPRGEGERAGCERINPSLWRSEVREFGLESNGRQTTISAVSKVEQIGAELQNLSRAELAQLRVLLDDLLEDELEFTPEFQSTLEQSEQEKSKGARPRTRQV